MMRLLILCFFVVINVFAQQDTIQLNEVQVYAKQNSTILKKIQKNFKKKFVIADDFYQVLVNSVCNDQNIFSIDEKNVRLGAKFLEKRQFSKHIEEKLTTDYFKNKDIDDFHSPEFLITKAGFRYVELDKYITKMQMKKMESIGHNLLVISGSFSQYIIELCFDEKTLDVQWLKINTEKPLYEQATSKTRGTSKYTNASSDYYLQEAIFISYVSENEKLFLNNFENNMQITDYNVWLFDKNKKNNLAQHYIFQLESFIQLKKQDL